MLQKWGIWLWLLKNGIMVKSRTILEFFIRPLPCWYSRSAMVAVLILNALLTAQVYIQGKIIWAQKLGIDYLLQLLQDHK